MFNYICLVLLTALTIQCQLVEIEEEPHIFIEGKSKYKVFDNLIVLLLGANTIKPDTVFNAKYQQQNDFNNLLTYANSHSDITLAFLGFDTSAHLSYFETRDYTPSPRKLKNHKVIENAGIPIITHFSENMDIMINNKISFFIDAIDHDNNIDSIYWDIDNYKDWDIKGKYSTHRKIQWTYTNAGDYNVEAVIVDKFKNKDSVSIKVDVDAPSAVIILSK